MHKHDYEEIVLHRKSPTLVLAGPGAGKTYLLADRIKRLLNSGVDKDMITVLTFGKDAQKSMREKLIDPSGDFRLQPIDLPRISTLHSLGFEIVKAKPRKFHLKADGLTVQHDEDVKRLLYRDAALILGFSEKDANEARICKQTGGCKEDPNEVSCRICRKYWEIMSKCNCIDFDDQILFACEILEVDVELLADYQKKAEHLLIDEYQDINAAQFRMIDLLSRSSQNGLFVVGDDAQSIYGFRGSTPEFILRFDKDFHNAVAFPLAHSRRCPKSIMEDSVKILEKHYHDWSGRQELQFHRKDEAPAEIVQLPSESAEADFVAIVTRDAVNKKKEVLILAPKKEFFPRISRALSKADISHECPASLLPQDVEKRLRIAGLFVEWVQDPSDNFGTRRAIEVLINEGAAKVPGARKGSRCNEGTIKHRVQEETSIAQLWEAVDRDNDLYSVVKASASPSESLVKIQQAFAHLLSAYGETTTSVHGEFVKELAVETGIWVDASKLVKDISSLVRQLEPQGTSGSSRVRLMSMRKAKGLEADVVIIVGLEDDLMPGSSTDITEAARLLYVSMTRAKEKLFLLHAYKRPRDISYGQDLMDKKRSRFLDAVGRPSEYKKLRH